MRLLLTAVLLWGIVGSAVAADDIFDAARRGDAAAVKAALDAGAPVDGKWRYDQTALYIAAFRGHTEVAKLLLDRGADPNARDTFYKMTALEAATQKSPEIVAMLVAKGAKGWEGMLTGAAGRGRTEMVKALLPATKWPQDALDEALVAAEAKKQSEIAKLLRDAGAKPLPKPNFDPALISAVAGKYTAQGVSSPLTLSVEDGAIVKLAVPGQTFEYRVADANNFVSLTEPRTSKLVVEREGDKVKGIDFINPNMKLRLVPEVAK